VWSPQGGGGGLPAARIEAGQEMGTEGGGGIRGTRITVVVPGRGRIWSVQVGPVVGQAWCPGTYHLSVAIMGRREARAFGTATFTVRR
jgi:hypothetical protein